MSHSDKPLKIILLGDSAVGKSKLVERFLVDGYHAQQQSTHALSLFTYRAQVGEEAIEIDFWDTAGQERFNNVHVSYYHQAHACLLVFDTQRERTYKNLDKWYKELQQHRGKIPTLVLANKIDIDRSVTEKTFNFATRENLPFYFVSAAEGTNVVKAFKHSIDLAKECRDNPEKDFISDILELVSDD